MSRPTATVETLYSRGDIGSLPDVGPERPDFVFEEEVRRRRAAAGKPPNHVEKHKTREIQPEGEDFRQVDNRLLISGAFWAYIIITIILAIAVALLANDAYCSDWLGSSGNRSTAFPNSALFFTVSFIMVIFIIWGAYRGHIGAPTDSYRYTLIITYVINLVLILIWGYLLFTRRDPKSAFLVSVLLILTTVWWIWLLWPIDQVASCLLVLYLIWLVYLAWASFQLKDCR